MDTVAVIYIDEEIVVSYHKNVEKYTNIIGEMCYKNKRNTLNISENKFNKISKVFNFSEKYCYVYLLNPSKKDIKKWIQKVNKELSESVENHIKNLKNLSKSSKNKKLQEVMLDE